MVDYAGLRREWDVMLERRPAWREPLGFWTRVLDAWVAWRPGSLRPLDWAPARCREAWQRGVPLLLETDLELPRDLIEDLVGPVIEPLALSGPDEEHALRAFVRQWDEGAAGPADLLPLPGKGGSLGLAQMRGTQTSLVSFLAQAGLRPPLETYFAAVRALPGGLWAPSVCPWCGGQAAFCEILVDGTRRLCCHLCGGAWAPTALRCPVCGDGGWGALIGAAGEAIEAMEPGDVLDVCPLCRGYVKGVDRRQRPTALSPLVEDWGSPHLDLLAMRLGYQRSTPSVAELLREA